MQFLVGILISIALGYRAKQKGRDGLKFGAGVAAVLLGSSAVLGFYDQAVGADPVIWWVIAAFTVVMAWMRLEKPTGTPPQAEVAPSASAQAPAAPSAAAANASDLKPAQSGLVGWIRKQKSEAILIAVAGLGWWFFVGQEKYGDKPAHTSTVSASPSVAKAASSQYFVTPAVLSGEDLARLLETKMPREMPIAAWPSQGFGFSDRTRLFLQTDNFGTVKKVKIDQLGVRTSTGTLHEIPKFALMYYADPDAKQESFMLASLKGPGNPIRLTFDTDPKYIEMTPNDGDFVMGLLNGELRKRMASAKSMTVLHAVSASGEEIALSYDLEELRTAAKAALATLNSK
jgi:hypothetical protein